MDRYKKQIPIQTMHALLYSMPLLFLKGLFWTLQVILKMKKMLLKKFEFLLNIWLDENENKLTFYFLIILHNWFLWWCIFCWIIIIIKHYSYTCFMFYLFSIYMSESMSDNNRNAVTISCMDGIDKFQTIRVQVHLTNYFFFQNIS